MINMRQYVEDKLKTVCEGKEEITLCLDTFLRKGTLTSTVLKYKYHP